MIVITTACLSRVTVGGRKLVRCVAYSWHVSGSSDLVHSDKWARVAKSFFFAFSYLIANVLSQISDRLQRNSWLAESAHVLRLTQRLHKFTCLCPIWNLRALRWTWRCWLGSRWSYKWLDRRFITFLLYLRGWSGFSAWRCGRLRSFLLLIEQSTINDLLELFDFRHHFISI